MSEVIARAHELVREGSEDRQPLYDCIDDLLVVLNEKSNTVAAQAERIKALEEGFSKSRDAAHEVWGLVCNVDHGDLEQQDPEWYKAFLRIRDTYFASETAARALLEKP